MATDRDPNPPETEEVDDALIDLEDDSGVADEPDEQAAEGEEPDEVEARPARQRADYREIARQEAEHRARVERELAELRSQVQQRQQPQGESEEAFELRMQVLPTGDQVRERLARAERRHQHEMLMTRLAAADAADRASFTAKAASNPVFKKYETDVEQILRAERQAGRDFPRETILAFVLGKKVMENRGKVDTARQQGQRRIAQQQARAPDARSDQASNRQRQRYAADDMSPEAVRYRLSQPGVFI